MAAIRARAKASNGSFFHFFGSKKELAGTITASWGDQMRSYFLYGQQLVKDLRTGHEVGNPAVVFDGDLDGFIAAGIRWRKSRVED